MIIEYCISDKGFVGIECPRCHNVITIPITEEELLSWNPEEEFVQNKFPQLSPSEREMLLSGICEKCWDDLIVIEDE